MEAANNLHSALLLARKEFLPIKKDKEAKAGASFTFKYASLDSIQDSTYEALIKYKLSIVHYIKDSCLTTRLSHPSGEFLESSIKITDSPEAKKVGADITYYRRYNVQCLLDIVADEDMDTQIQDSLKPVASPNRALYPPKKAPAPSTKTFDGPANSVIPFGPNKGKKFVELTHDTIQSALDWAQSKSPGKDGKPAFASFQDDAIAYLASNSYNDQEFPEGF